MRLPFELSNNKLEDDARVRFIYTSPELHQNIEISLDGENTSIDAILDAFQRFLGALGVSIPQHVAVGFVDLSEEDDEEDDNDDEDDNDEDKPKKRKKDRDSDQEE